MPGSDQGRPVYPAHPKIDEENPIMPHPMTDQEWEAQNSSLSPDEATARGLCWCCQSSGILYTAFGGVQREVPCPEKCDNGKARR
ncbi:hypothetical protein ABZX82_01980 [Streptomyces griseoflavus]|uniref:hypothetical protein n=1 Tax=Streptomyces griseoflavus TaxID=35619 RepID=UPI0033A964C3